MHVSTFVNLRFSNLPPPSPLLALPLPSAHSFRPASPRESSSQRLPSRLAHPPRAQDGRSRTQCSGDKGNTDETLKNLQSRSETFRREGHEHSMKRRPYLFAFRTKVWVFFSSRFPRRRFPSFPKTRASAAPPSARVALTSSTPSPWPP